MSAPKNITREFIGDSQGNCYRVSVEARPFVSGARKIIYKGVLSGNGPRNNEVVIVKPFREFAGTSELCDVEIAKNYEAHRISQSYNRTFQQCGQSLQFILPKKASMDIVVNASSDNNVGKTRQLQSGEWVLVEENIGDNFKKYVDDQGRSTLAGSSLLHAFIHFSYHDSQGALVVCCMQGVETDSRTTLATPTIHSMDRQFGDMDKGEAGILQVFLNHKCNNMCRDFLLPHMLKNLSGSSI